MDIKIISLKENPNLLDDCINFVVGVFGNREFFEKQLTESINTDLLLPQGYILIKQNKIIGYCALIKMESIVRYDLSPFISTVIIAASERGNAYGAKLLEHVRKEAGKLGFVKLYLTTDHIGFYEKYGFKEIGITNFNWGRPAKIYQHHTIGLPIITDRLLADYPNTVAILLGGSFARDDGILVQDIDIKLIIDGELMEDMRHRWFIENGIMYDISFETVEAASDMEHIVSSAYDAGFYNDATILYDKNNKFTQYLADFKEQFAKPLYLEKRITGLTTNLKNQYNDVIRALRTGNEINIYCLFATYTWTLCDVLLVSNLCSPSWIRGLQKLGKVDKTMMNKVVALEGHRSLEKETLISLLPLYSQSIGTDDWWNFLKSSIEWLICNNNEPQGFHSLNICFMMGMEHKENKQELFEKWLHITGVNKILPLMSMDEYKNFHSEVLMYLNAKKSF